MAVATADAPLSSSPGAAAMREAPLDVEEVSSCDELAIDGCTAIPADLYAELLCAGEQARIRGQHQLCATGSGNQWLRSPEALEASARRAAEAELIARSACTNQPCATTSTREEASSRMKCLVCPPLARAWGHVSRGLDRRRLRKEAKVGLLSAPAGDCSSVAEIEAESVIVGKRPRRR